MSVDTINHSTIKAPPGYYKLAGELVATTDKAKLFRVDSINDFALETYKELWFPNSLLKSFYRKPIGVIEDKDVIIVSNWICEQTGLI